MESAVPTIPVLVSSWLHRCKNYTPTRVWTFTVNFKPPRFCGTKTLLLARCGWILLRLALNFTLIRLQILKLKRVQFAKICTAGVLQLMRWLCGWVFLAVANC